MKNAEQKVTRRRFLNETGALAAALLLASKQTVFGQKRNFRKRSDANLIKPQALRAGDTIGLITPATEVLEPERLAAAAETLNYFGLQVKFGKNVGKRFASYNEFVGARLDDLHEMFRNRTVKGVFAVRGGYGAMQLLDRVDYDLIRRNPKVFVGYSDITALHLAINKNSKLVTFHGPVALSRFTEYTQRHFQRALFEKQPLGKLTNPDASGEIFPSHNLRTIGAGVATGQLTGGNLSLICATLGTPYEIDTRGKILFLEDVGEAPYRIDRMLTQLKLAGKLRQAAGIIWGECEDCGDAEVSPAAASPYNADTTAENILSELKIPVLAGLTIGHTGDQLTLPMGLTATLDANSGTLEIKESGVI